MRFRLRSVQWLLWVLLALGATGCSSVQLADYAGEQPRFDMQQYFNGPVVAHGIVQDRSGKVIRRMLRKIAGNVYDDLGDTTALAKPEVLDHIIVGHRNLLQGQHETANLPDEDQPKE